MIFSAVSPIPVLSSIVILSLTILLIALFLRKLKQPYFIAYILAGVLLGPEVFGVITAQEAITQLGNLGLILLMFFIGAEIKLPNLTQNVKKPLLGAIAQVGLSFVCIAGLGWYMEWPWNTIIVLSFVISLSSSAIIFQYLYLNQAINTPLGILTAGVLLVQDILVIPMLIVLSFLGKGELETTQLISICLGGLLSTVFLRAAMKHHLFRLPFASELRTDQDLQVFVGLLFCFGFAWVTHLLSLSPALGAFLAGILIGQDTSTHWLKQSLVPFRVFFLAFFFLSVGLQLNLSFFAEHILIIATIALLVLLINSFINSLIFKGMGVTWRNSVYAGALLSQIGEFSFVLCTTAYNLALIKEYSYQITLSVIMLTMTFSTVWISIIQRFVFTLPSKRKLHIKSHY